MALRKEEITRKLLHLFALLMPAGIFYLPRFNVPDAVPIGILAFLVVGSITVESLRFRIPAVQKIFFVCFGHLLRQEEDRKVTGSTYIMAAALLCSLIFINHKYISLIVLTIFILGDAIAAIAGLSIGRIKIGKKSLEGSLACFAVCMALFYGLFPYLPPTFSNLSETAGPLGVMDAWGGKVPLILALAASLSTTVFELIPLRITKKLTINDNLAVPVITGGIMLLMERWI
jgi:dolichol kinase